MADSAFNPLGQNLPAGPVRSVDGVYESAETSPEGGVFKFISIMWKFFFAKPANTRPAGVIPVQAITRADLLAAPDRTVYKLGHSTLLFKLRGKLWLTDPVFSKRASPFQFAGPKRFHAPPISIDDLPEIEGVILSHDHYDHLDKGTILRLADKVNHFITARGVGDLLIEWGVEAENIRQLHWWQSIDVDGLRLVATPTQHFSGRGLFHRNRTLWSSWVILDREFKIFYGADSGYFEGFQEIGEQFGPFDVTFLENGAYNENWAEIHMQPEETAQAHLDLRGRRLVPIHNGTFDLAMHPWFEPMERIWELAERHGIAIRTPRFGEPLHLEETDDRGAAGNAAPGSELGLQQGWRLWWRGVDRGTDRRN